MFESIAKDIYSGGPMMIAVLLLGLATWSALLVMVALHAFRRSPVARRVASRLVGALALVLMGCGAYGAVSCFRTALEAITHVKPADAGIIYAAAGAESLIVVQWALALGLIPLAAAWLLSGLAAPKAVAAVE